MMVVLRLPRCMWAIFSVPDVSHARYMSTVCLRGEYNQIEYYQHTIRMVWQIGDADAHIAKAGHTCLLHLLQQRISLIAVGLAS